MYFYIIGGLARTSGGGDVPMIAPNIFVVVAIWFFKYECTGGGGMSRVRQKI